MSNEFRITWHGLDELKRKLRATPGELERSLEFAGKEAGEHVLNQEGLRRYPPSGAGNQPPTPYYIRGRGTQYANRNTNSSERYGTRFYVETEGQRTYVGNTSSYAPYLTDSEGQAAHMAALGWKKLIDVVQQQLPTIAAIYDAWLRRALERAGLR